MKSTQLFFLILFCYFNFTSLSIQNDFVSDQKKYARVRETIQEKEKILKDNLTSLGLNLTNFNLLLVAYKASNELDLYVKKKSEEKYTKLISYNICSKSGELGPKRKQGDYQVPEGFYHIDRFNPTSTFHLSLGINYPNSSDRIKSKASNLGGDIFIHGNCVTIGCLPMTDDCIKEIYLYAVHAKNNGQNKIPVYIFPFRLNDILFNEVKSIYNNTEMINFWANLKEGHDLFEKEHKELKIKVNSNGDYVYN